jgi:TPR repeat protein
MFSEMKMKNRIKAPLVVVICIIAFLAVGVSAEARKNGVNFTALAEQGNVEAQFRLGIKYGSGGKDRNDAEARKWLKKAAEQGHIIAQYQMGIISGWYNPPNHKEAEFWLAKAVAQGHPDAVYYYKYMRRPQEKPTKTKYSAEERINHRDALIDKAEQGGADAQLQIALWHLANQRLDGSSKTKANKWLKKASDQGHMEAQFQLGMTLYGESSNGDKAKVLLSKAAKQGHKKAKTYLEYMQSVESVHQD